MRLTRNACFNSKQASIHSFKNLKLIKVIHFFFKVKFSHLLAFKVLFYINKLFRTAFANFLIHRFLFGFSRLIELWQTYKQPVKQKLKITIASAIMEQETNSTYNDSLTINETTDHEFEPPRLPGLVIFFTAIYALECFIGFLGQI